MTRLARLVAGRPVALLAAAAALALLALLPGGGAAAGALRAGAVLGALALAAAALRRPPPPAGLRLRGALALGRATGVALIEAGGRRLLVGFGPTGVFLLADLPVEAAP